MTIWLFDAAGRELAVQRLGACRAGVHTLDGSVGSWVEDSGRPLAAGTYWMRLETSTGRASKRWVVLR